MIRGAPCDVRAAPQNGVRAVAVLWGYGSREELTRTIHEPAMNSPPFGLRPAPIGRLLRISRSAELTTKPAGTPLAFPQAVMSERAAFANNPG
jgi:hypothetical protein